MDGRKIALGHGRTHVIKFSAPYPMVKQKHDAGNTVLFSYLNIRTNVWQGFYSKNKIPSNAWNILRVTAVQHHSSLHKGAVQNSPWSTRSVTRSGASTSTCQRHWLKFSTVSQGRFFLKNHPAKFFLRGPSGKPLLRGTQRVFLFDCPLACRACCCAHPCCCYCFCAAYWCCWWIWRRCCGAPLDFWGA